MNEKRGEDRTRDVSEVVSVVGTGMKVTGDCVTDGTLRVEGRVEGTIRAAKAVVVGEGGVVAGDIQTQDAVVAGTVQGSIAAESRVELQATCRIEGDIRSRRVKLEEGGQVDGRLEMGRSRTSSGRGTGSPQASTAASGGSGRKK